MPAGGRHLHRDTGEKDKSVAPYLLRVSAQFLLPELQGECQNMLV